MATKLFVGGLPYETTQDELHKIFSGAGKVFGVKLIMDRETGRSKGFGFVEMATEADAEAALRKLNGSGVGDRKIFITEARPQAAAEGRPKEKPAGFVERRSGKDRRQAPGFGSPAGAAKPASAERRAGSFGEKKWSPKPGGFGGKKPWGDKPTGDRKPWGDKRAGGKKPWSGKPAGDRKPWHGKAEGKPGGFSRRVKRGSN